MVMVNGSPIAPDGVGGAYKNTDSDDRAALWQSLGARQGMLSGGAVTAVAGSLALQIAAFRAAVEERDSAGNGLDRGYHAWTDDDITVPFDPPDAQVRSDAVVLAVADTSAGAGSFGTGVSQAGPQLVVVRGVSGTSTPRLDSDVQAWVGSGGWMRLADVPISPGDTQVNMATAVLAPASLYGWHTVGDPGEPALKNGWTQDPATKIRFRKDAAGRVSAHGFLTNFKNGQVAFTFPDGYRPPRDMGHFPQYGPGATPEPWVGVNYFANGDVMFWLDSASGATGVNVNFAFDTAI